MNNADAPKRDMDDWDSINRWRQILERRLNTLGSQVRGNQEFQADRISDVVAMIDAVAKEVEALRERIDKAATYVKTLKKD